MKYAIFLWAMLWVFRPAFPILDYIWHYDYIKNELCVNKDRPELACNGKCHLRAQLAQTQNEAPKSPIKAFDSKCKWQPIDLWMTYFPSLTLYPSENVNPMFKPQGLGHNNYSPRFFHPPAHFLFM